MAVKRIKSVCLHNICGCTVYNYYIYINTHTCLYIFKKYFHVLFRFKYNRGVTIDFFHSKSMNILK